MPGSHLVHLRHVGWCDDDGVGHPLELHLDAHLHTAQAEGGGVLLGMPTCI